MTAQKSIPKSMDERFRGLTREQIGTLVEIDIDAMRAQSLIETVAIRVRFNKAHIPFGERNMRYYADLAEAEGKNGVAFHWHKAFVDTTNDPRELRAFAIRTEMFIEADKIGPLTKQERTSFAKMMMRKNNGLDGAYALFRDLGDLSGVREVLNRALECGNVSVAKMASKLLHRRLTRAEKIQLGKAMLIQGDDPEDAVSYIIKEKLHELVKPLMKHIVRNEVLNYPLAKKTAQQLNIVLSTRDLQTMYSNDLITIDDQIEIAEELAKRSPSWQKRLPGIYLQTRTKLLEVYRPSCAQVYALRCHKPLTIKELHAVMEHIRHDDRYRSEYNFALDLISLLIAKRVESPRSKRQTKKAA